MQSFFKLAILAVAFQCLVFGQQVNNPPVRWQSGTAAPSSGACDASTELGGIYLQTGDPASVRTQNFVCTQTGASTYGWMPFYGKIQDAAPATCSVGDLWFDSNATAGSNIFGCTSANTWTAQGGGGGSGDSATVVSTAFSATPTFTADSNTATMFTMTLTGNVTSCTLAGMTAGQEITLRLTQDGTGTRTFACTGFGGLGTINTTASAVCTQAFVATSSSAVVSQGTMGCTGGATSSITVGDKTLTFPQDAGTVALPANSEVITTNTATQTLTNKTLTSPDINDGNINVDGGTLEVPNSDTLPGTCTVGQSYMDTNATTGQRWYLCESTNTWVAQGGGSSFDPTDLSTFTFRDNFCHAPNSTYTSPDVRTNIGDFGTWWNALGTTAAGITFASTPAHPCVMVGTTTASSSNEWYLINQNLAGPVINPSTQTNTTTKFVFSIDNVATATFGFSYNTSVRNTCDASANNCIGVYFIAGTDTVFRFRTCSGGSCSDSASTVTPANGTIYTFVMSVTSSGTWSFSINGETAVTRTANLANATLYPVITLTTNTTATRAMSLYGYTFQRTGLTF